MNINKYAENRGKRNVISFLLIDLKRETKEDFVLVMKAKTHIRNALLQRNLLDKHKCDQLTTEKIWKKYNN